LTTDEDALSCMKVCRQWCDIAYPLIWQRPVIRNLAGFANVARVLLSPDSTQHYADAVRRINLANVTDEYDDEMFMSLRACVKTERMTLGPRSMTSPRAMCQVFGSMPKLVAIDLSNLSLVDDAVIKTLAQTCTGLQGLNINGCRLVGDEAICLLAEKCKNLRRVSSLLHPGLTVR
jgi:F-box and leucine-rich repeat protein GRR1